MTIKTILYIAALPLTLFALDALHFEKLLKKDRVTQARILYLLLAIGLSYLIVNFIYDFYMNTQLI